MATYNHSFSEGYLLVIIFVTSARRTNEDRLSSFWENIDYLLYFLTSARRTNDFIHNQLGSAHILATTSKIWPVFEMESYFLTSAQTTNDITHKHLKCTTSSSPHPTTAHKKICLVTNLNQVSSCEQLKGYCWKWIVFTIISFSHSELTKESV